MASNQVNVGAMMRKVDRSEGWPRVARDGESQMSAAIHGHGLPLQNAGVARSGAQAAWISAEYQFQNSCPIAPLLPEEVGQY